MLTSCRQLTWTSKFFSIFFRLKKILYRVMRKNGERLLFSAVYRSPTTLRVVRDSSLVFLLYFSYKTRDMKIDENMMKFMAVCVWLAVFHLKLHLNTHEWASPAEKEMKETLQSQKNISQGEQEKKDFCNYLRRFPFEWRWDSNNGQVVRDTRRNKNESEAIQFS